MTSTLNKLVLVAAAAVTSFAMAAPASAVVTTFASFNLSTGGSIIWQNNGTGGNNTNYRGNGTGGSAFGTTSASNVRPANAVPGPAPVTFSFQNALSPFVTNVAATLTLTGSVVNTPTVTFAGVKIQQGISGSFQFLSAAPININGTIYGPGANLLSATYSSAQIVGTGTSGSFAGSTLDAPGVSIVYTSDFLDFSNTVSRDFSFSLTSIVSLLAGNNLGLNNQAGRALRSFRASATGSFSSDPAPRIPGINTVPEPQTWAMLVIGFGMVGVTVRRRSRASRVVSA